MSYIDPRHKVLTHLGRLQDIKAGRTPPPINVEIDLSNRCSLGCEWCHFAYTHTRGPLAGKVATPNGRMAGSDLMDTTLAFDILDQLGIAGVRSVTWTGGGEPTLHPDFDTIIQYAHDDVGIDQGLYTHGGHISAARAELLKRAMRWVYVSLDECNQADYHRSKRVDRFHHALAGIRNLVDAAGDATVGIGFLLHPGNLRQVEDMVELFQDIGADYCQFRPTVAYDQHQPCYANEDTSWIDAAVEYLREVEELPGVMADLERFRMYQEWTVHPYTTCNWSAVQTVITPNGRVWRCVNKREHTGALMGDLSTDSFANIWSRAGGPCRVDADCRVMCRGHIGNITLDAIMTEPAHRNFI